jgi:hypothetical protein
MASGSTASSSAIVPHDLNFLEALKTDLPKFFGCSRTQITWTNVDLNLKLIQVINKVSLDVLIKTGSDVLSRAKEAKNHDHSFCLMSNSNIYSTYAGEWDCLMLKFNSVTIRSKTFKQFRHHLRRIMDLWMHNQIMTKRGLYYTKTSLFLDRVTQQTSFINGIYLAYNYVLFCTL